MSTPHPTGHISPITIADLHEALADLLTAILAAHPDPVHAAYPPIARAIALLGRYDDQQHVESSPRATPTARAE
ncbi:MAG: hypothetical protein M3440_06220 [Chloroflexota bacterium]|nr:hypothetical protein [Chloroflexota bacterium]